MAPVRIVSELKEIATVGVAIALWSHLDTPYLVWKRINTWLPIFEELNGLQNGLPVPKSVAEQIYNYVRKMKDSFQVWVEYNSSSVFRTPDKKYDWYCSLDLIIWNYDGTINYKETARNLTNSRRLSDVDKYRIVSTYCLQEEIERISLSLGRQYLDRVDFEYSPLIFYWNCYLRNQLHKVPVVGDVSIDSFMFHHEKVSNWSAKEYFFQRLNPEEQVHGAIWLINTYREMYQKEVLMKLNDSQLLQVYMEKPAEIMANYTNYNMNMADVLLTWYDIKNLITSNQFASIINTLVHRSTPDNILAEIWASVCDEFKNVASSFGDHQLIQRLFSSWQSISNSNSQSRDFLFTVLKDISVGIKHQILKAEFFELTCTRLIMCDNLSMVQRLLNMWPSEDAELIQFKKNLSNKDFFYTYYKQIIRSALLATLRQLSVYFLLEDGRFEQRLAEDEDFMKSCQKLIVRDRVMKLERLLKICFPTVDWLAQFKQKVAKESFFMERCKKLIDTYKILTLGRLLTLYIADTEERENFKQQIANEKFFDIYCERLVRNNKILTLGNWLEFYYLDSENVVRFKETLVKKKFFSDHCGTLMDQNKILTLDCLLSSCILNTEELLRFKKNLVTKEYFEERCEKLIDAGKLLTLEKWLKFYFINDDELLRFKQDLVKKKYFWKHCADLINNEETERLVQLLTLCLPDTKKSAQFVQDIAIAYLFDGFCDTLVVDGRVNRMYELLRLCLQDHEELVRFVRRFVRNSELLESRCLSYYHEGNLEGLNTWLAQLLESCPDFIPKYKQHVLMTSDGINTCVEYFASKIDTLMGIIADAFPDPGSAAEFKKGIIFSPSSIDKLRASILRDNKGLNDLKTRIDDFLVSNEDKNSLKKQLIESLEPSINELFVEYGLSRWQSLICWLEEDKDAVRKWKQKLSLDRIFEGLLQKCVFDTFDELRRVSRCSLKKNLEFDSLDMFLKWYFNSPKKVKDYKLQRIDSYERIETVNILLQKNGHSSYLKNLIDWFFGGDIEQMTKFKKSHEKDKISKSVKIVRESYFKK